MVWFGLGVAWGCEGWSPPTELLPIDHPDLIDASGLAASRRGANTYWTHDDAGRAVLYRFSLDGAVTAHDVPGADNQDWEDLAAAPCAGGGECVYIGDIGIPGSDPTDDGVDVYVVREPRGDGPAMVVETWRLRWPAGPIDAEALLVHPCTREAWIVTKTVPPVVYRVPSGRGPNGRRALEEVGPLAVSAEITAADFAPDGRALVLRSNDTVWRLAFDPADPAGSFAGTLDVVASLQGSNQAQGEGIAWDLDGDLVVVGEGQGEPTPVGRLACAVGEPPPVCEPVRGCASAPAPAGGAGWGWLAVALGALAARRSAGPRHGARDG